MIIDPKNALVSGKPIIPKTTFKKEIELYEERPLLIACEKTRDNGIAPSLNHLRKHEKILHVGADTK